MESLAEPNTCFLTATTAALVRGYFALDNLGDFRVKGVTEPVRVHRLAGTSASRTRFDISRARGLSRFVGRWADIRTLEDAVAQSAAGNGQVVGVMAEAGTGKSRLCFEFLERRRSRGMTVYEGRAVVHGRNIPYLPILELFRAYFGITTDDDDRSAREKIAGRMVLLDLGFADALPLLFDFLGVPDPQRPTPRLDPAARQRQLLAVMRKVIQTLSEERPTITLVEDLHWLDEPSGEFLAHMVDARAGSPQPAASQFSAGAPRRVDAEVVVSADPADAARLVTPIERLEVPPRCKRCWRRASIGCRSVRSGCCRRRR